MANIFETARAEHQYNKFVSGIESLAGLVDTLSGPGPFTIFVPSDACIGYLDHPFKNKPIKTEKEILSLLANTGGSV